MRTRLYNSLTQLDRSLALLVTLSLAGCAVEHRLPLRPGSVVRVMYQPKDCKQQQDGSFECNHVRFVCDTVRASQ